MRENVQTEYPQICIDTVPRERPTQLHEMAVGIGLFAMVMLSQAVFLIGLSLAYDLSANTGGHVLGSAFALLSAVPALGYVTLRTHGIIQFVEEYLTDD